MVGGLASAVSAYLTREIITSLVVVKSKRLNIILLVHNLTFLVLVSVRVIGTNNCITIHTINTEVLWCFLK